MRPSAHELYVERINRAIDHVLAHLGEPLRLEEVARIGAFSPCHFHRVFKAVVGETLGEFVKRQRLEKAVFSMKYGGTRSLTEVAFDSGFSSSSDFSRSFKQRFGFAPSQATPERIAEVAATLGPEGIERAHARARDAQSGDWEVDVRRHPARRVAYVRVHDPYRGDGMVRGLHRLMDWAEAHGREHAALIGMSQDDPEITPLDRCRYDWCLDLGELPARAEGAVGVTTLPENHFAVVSVRGDLERVAHAWDWLFGQWLIHSPWEPTKDPAMEVMLDNPVRAGWEHWNLEGWVPVRPLQRPR